MQIIIHRGINQVGGTITEVRTSTSRIFIDMGDNFPGNGEPLTDSEKEELVNGFFFNEKRAHEAVFYTHGHNDHVGMMHLVPQNVPQFFSKGTRDILLLKEDILSTSLKNVNTEKYDEERLSNWQRRCNNNERRLKILNSCTTWHSGINTDESGNSETSFIVGDISITPYKVSHSTFDPHMFLIEADGERLLHTGDYRLHGHLAKDLISTLKSIGEVDYLITEATMLRDTATQQTEEEISERMAAVMSAFKYVFVLVSATDVERLATINGAAKSQNRMLVTCGKLIDESMNYFTQYYKDSNNPIFDFNHYKLSPTEPSINFMKRMRKEGFVMPFGGGQRSAVQEIMQHFDPDQTLLIYSAWDGYYKLEEQRAINSSYYEAREMFGNVVDLHTSGHCDVPGIRQVITTLSPRKAIIAIHKDPGTTLTTIDLPAHLKTRIIPDTLTLPSVTTN